MRGPIVETIVTQRFHNHARSPDRGDLHLPAARGRGGVGDVDQDRRAHDPRGDREARGRAAPVRGRGARRAWPRRCSIRSGRTCSRRRSSAIPARGHGRGHAALRHGRAVRGRDVGARAADGGRAALRAGHRERAADDGHRPRARHRSRARCLARHAAVRPERGRRDDRRDPVRRAGHRRREPDARARRRSGRAVGDVPRSAQRSRRGRSGGARPRPRRAGSSARPTVATRRWSSRPRPAAPRTGPMRAVLVLDRAATMQGDATVVARPFVRALLGALGTADRVAIDRQRAARVDARPPTRCARSSRRGRGRAGRSISRASLLAARPEGAALRADQRRARRRRSRPRSRRPRRLARPDPRDRRRRRPRRAGCSPRSRR